MSWARLALVPSAITVNLAFLYVVVKNAPGEVFDQHLGMEWNSIQCLPPRLISCISPQASRTFVAWLECLESIISFILNTFSCSSRQPTSSNRFVGSSLFDQTMTTFYLDLCCSWLCLLECVSWCHLWNPLWLHSLFSSYCLWSFPLLLFSKVREVFKENMVIFNGICHEGGGVSRVINVFSKTFFFI